MKKLLTRIFGKWFMGLTLGQKAICLYFVISFTLFGCMVSGPWWAMGIIAANFAVSALLLKRVPLDEA